MEEGHAYTFEVSWGMVGWIAGSHGVARLILPDGAPDDLRDLLVRDGARTFLDRPPELLAPLEDALHAYFDGAPIDPATLDVPLDDRGWSPLDRRVYPELRRVVRGTKVTYGELADRVGKPGAARAIGGAMGRNPVPLLVPCHRVLARGARLGGFSAQGGVATKRRLLELEGLVEPTLFPGMG